MKTFYKSTNKALVNKANINLENLSTSGYQELPIRNKVLGVALADYVGRTPIEELKGQIPCITYHDTDVIASYGSGDTITPIDLIDEEILTIAKYDLTREEKGSLGLIVSVNDDIRDDAGELINDAIDFTHTERLINTENKRICENLISGKTPIETTPETVSVTMNKYLSGKAKRKAYIITNGSGFGKLDVKDSFGNNLIKRTADGRFIYGDKYEIIEIDDDLLPNLEGGAPIIAGDIAGACTLLMNGSTRSTYDKGMVVVDNFQKRFIDTERPQSLTKSDKCYIVGYLA